MPTDKPLAWVTGSGGLIGNYLVQTATECAREWDVFGLTRPVVDLTDRAAVTRLFQLRRPELVIHCAAVSRSTVCERDADLARQTNVVATAIVAELAHNIPLVFFSSDLVFDGAQGNYDESVAPNPLSLYAETKVAAEQIILANPRHTVIRTSLNGGTSPKGDRGFNEEMRRAWQAGKTLKFFVDEYRSPMAAIETARAVWALVAAKRPGLYHLAGSERLSRYRIGELIAARWPDIHPSFTAGSIREYAGPPRPPDTSLDCRKIQALLPFPLPGLTAWLMAHPEVAF